jgi:replication factor C large subunit
VARDRSQSAFELVRSVFGDKDSKKPLNISYAVDETPEDLVHWIDENAPRALDGKRLSHAFQTLSRADIFLGRTRKRQNYGLWKYAAELMTSGVNIAARQNHGHYNAGAKYSPPTHWMRLGQTRLKRGLRDAVASKIASVNHVSVTKAREEIFPLYKELALRDPAGITATLTLSADELAFLMGVKKDTPSIKKALEEAGRLTNEQTPQVGPISKHEPEFTLDSPTHRLRNGFTTTPETSSPRTSERTASASDKNGKTGMKRPQRHLDEF